MRRFHVLLVFLILALSGVQGLRVSAWSGEIFWHVSGSGAPGSILQVELEFRNTGLTELLIRSVSLSGWGLLERELNVTVPPGSASYLGIFYVRIPENATAGVHRLRMTILMKERTEKEWVDRTWSVSVPIDVVRRVTKPKLDCRVLNETYVPEGDEIFLALSCNLSNLGNASLRGNLSVSLRNWSRTVEVELPPNSTRSFVFTLVVKELGEVRAVFSSSDIVIRRTVMPAPPASPSVQVTSIDYTTAYPGCSVPISIQLHNSGSRLGGANITLLVDGSLASSLLLEVPPGDSRSAILYWNVPLNEPPGDHRGLVNVCLPQGCFSHQFNLTVLPGGMPEVSRELRGVTVLMGFLKERGLGSPPSICERALDLWTSLNSTGDPELVDRTTSALRRCFEEMRSEACNHIGNISGLGLEFVERARSSERASDVVGNLTKALELTGRGGEVGEQEGGHLPAMPTPTTAPVVLALAAITLLVLMLFIKSTARRPPVLTGG